MASTTIKGTYALDVETVRALERLAQEWDVSKSEALRRLPGPLPTLTDPLRRVCDRVTPPVRWLRPNGRNGLQLLEIVKEVLAEGRSYAEFMLHSSEFMPGGSPTFQTEADIERLSALYEKEAVSKAQLDQARAARRDELSPERAARGLRRVVDALVAAI